MLGAQASSSIDYLLQILGNPEAAKAVADTLERNKAEVEKATEAMVAEQVKLRTAQDAYDKSVASGKEILKRVEGAQDELARITREREAVVRDTEKRAVELEDNAIKAAKAVEAAASARMAGMTEDLAALQSRLESVQKQIEKEEVRLTSVLKQIADLKASL